MKAASILVAGSIALDSIETPFGSRDDVLGGAATHFAAAASLFAPVRVVGVVGEDFPMPELDILRARDVDLSAVETAPGKSFRWRGRYHLDMDHRDTLALELGVFSTFRPTLSPELCQNEVLFLANVDPEVQLHVLEQVANPLLVGCDTIDHWIKEKRELIDELFSRVDLVFINEDEARLYAGTPNLQRAARTILELGCRAVLIKKGENGALVVTRDSIFVCPAYPLEEVVDPTGAGDTFAGGVMGVLARERAFHLAGLRHAVATGTVMASFSVEDFGAAAMAGVTPERVSERVDILRGLTEFEVPRPPDAPVPG